MAVKLEAGHLETIRQHGARDYPYECCGMLLGRANGRAKEVREVVPLKNLRREPVRAEKVMPVAEPAKETDRNRYLVDPAEQLRVEKDARARGAEVLGFYHSHPDHPARPSDYDREHAWPWYSYLIVSVARGKPEAVTAWVLSEDEARFEAETIEFG